MGFTTQTLSVGVTLMICARAENRGWIVRQDTGYCVIASSVVVVLARRRRLSCARRWSRVRTALGWIITIAAWVVLTPLMVVALVVGAPAAEE